MGIVAFIGKTPFIWGRAASDTYLSNEAPPIDNGPTIF